MRREPDTIRRKGMWRLVSAVSGMLTAMVVKKLLRSAYQAVSKEDADSAFDPTAKGFSWPNAVLWAIAVGLGFVIAKMVGDRLATLGWEAATGTLPPGAVDESQVD